MTIIFLDAATVDYGDVDFSSLKKCGTYIPYKHTEPKQVIQRAKNADIIISNKVKIDGSNIGSLTNLKLICVAATGYNNIDVNLAKKNKIHVANSVGYATQSVIEHMFMFLFTLSHRLIENNAAVFQGTWSRSKSFNLTDFPYANLKGKTLGIIGYGTIGRQVARFAKILGMTVLITKIPGRKYRKSPKRYPMSHVLKNSDFITLHCPLSPSTHHLIDANKLSTMKKNSLPDKPSSRSHRQRECYRHCP